MNKCTWNTLKDVFSLKISKMQNLEIAQDNENKFKKLKLLIFPECTKLWIT